MSMEIGQEEGFGNGPEFGVLPGDVLHTGEHFLLVLRAGKELQNAIVEALGSL